MITFCYTPEIHEFLVKIKGVTEDFSLWQPPQQTKVESCFIFGINVSYLLISSCDLPINYNEFHEIAANVMR